MKNFTNNFKQITSRLSARWLIMALMLLLGTSSAWAANEYGMRYLYVDCKNFTSYTQVNADMYWGVNCSDKAEYKSAFPICSNDNNVFYVDLKSLNSSSYTYYRAFEISQGSGWNDKKCFSVPANNKNNSIKISGWGAGSWSNFALTPSSVTLKVTSGTTGGTGTQNDPYLVEVGAQFTLSASNLTFSPADPVMVGRYNFGTSTTSTPTGTSTTSTQTASTTANTTTRYYVSVRGYYNGVYSSSYKTASVYVKTVASCIDATLSWANTFNGSMKVGDEVTNPASLSIQTAANGISYISSNPDVISVNGTKLTASKSGKAIITASATKNIGYCDIESITKEVTVTCDVVNTSEIVVEVECSDGTPNIYYWGGDVTTPSWPGEAMSGSNGVYTKKFTTTEPINVIFYIDGKQTVDISNLAVGKLHRYKFDPTNGSKNNDGKYLEDKLYEDCLLPACIPVTFSWTTEPVNMNYGETKDIVATLDPDAAGTVGYTASPAGIITFSDNQYTAVGKGDVTITATASLNGGYCPVSDLTKSIKVTCPTPEQPQLSIDQGITNDCGNVTNGIIAIDNYASFEGCTFTLNGNAVTPTSEGKIEGVTASGTCTVVVTNNCGNSSEPVSIDMTETTIKAPRTDFTVSLSYPQVAFAANNGSVYIDLSGSERNVTYYLYKNDVKVLESEKLGEGEALHWTVLESGKYTVKADNPCNGEIAMTGQVDFTCMSNLELAFEGGKSTFCPGETANVIVTFTGTGKGDEDTNAGKFGWQWGGSNYSYESIYLNESGVTMPVTINANGSIQLNVKTCNGPLSSDPLNFTVVTAPEKPQLEEYSKGICANETAEITISGYNDSYNYDLYKGEDKVGSPVFANGVFTVSEAGSYTIKAVEQECNIESTPSDPFNLTVNGTTITQSPEVVHPYEVVTFTAGEQATWTIYNNPSSGGSFENETYIGKTTAYITKGASQSTTFKGEAASGYVIRATVGDCSTDKSFDVVADPECE